MHYFFVFSLLLIGVMCDATMVKRSDDVAPLGNVVAKLASDVQSLQAQMAAVHNGMDLLKMNVGFVTTVSKDITVVNHMTVKFDVIQYNEGNGYDATSGFFTAPVTGLYSFFFKTEVNAGQFAVMQMMKEGERILYVYGTDHDSYQTPSAATVVHLAQGQRVWVESWGSSVLRNPWARFGGFLVHADVPN